MLTRAHSALRVRCRDEHITTVCNDEADGAARAIIKSTPFSYQQSLSRGCGTNNNIEDDDDEPKSGVTRSRTHRRSRQFTADLNRPKIFSVSQFSAQNTTPAKMVFLVRRVSVSLLKAASVSVRALSTKVQLKEDSSPAKEIVLKYLDGKDNGIAVLGLNRPEARNAFGKNLVSQLSDAVSTIEQDKKVRVLILRSLVPKIFCAGADLRERSKMEPQEVANFVSSLRDLMRDLEALSAPVISALDGVALGGGLEMALASDIRTASVEAKMGLVETKLAIIPGAGGTQRLPRIIGPALAKELIYTARILDGVEAHKIGLVNRVVAQNKEGDAAYQAALHIAREILPNGPIGVKLAKVAISKGIEVSIDDGFEIEKQCYAQLLDTEDRIEGLAAFASKRVPVYRGL